MQNVLRNRHQDIYFAQHMQQNLHISDKIPTKIFRFNDFDRFWMKLFFIRNDALQMQPIVPYKMNNIL